MNTSTISTRKGFRIIIEFEMGWLDITSGGSSQSIQFGGQLGLGLDERSTVIPHRLVTHVGILRNNGIDRCNQDEDEKCQSEGCIVYKENNAHYASYETLSRTTVSLNSSCPQKLRLTGWLKTFVKISKKMAFKKLTTAIEML